MSYQPKPVDTSGIELDRDLKNLTERLAENAHDLWAMQRMAQGWTFGPERDDHAKKHPCLVAYDDLRELEKEYDRQAAIGTLKAIAALGYKTQSMPPVTLPESDRYAGDHTMGEIELVGKEGRTRLPVFANRYISIIEDPVVFPDGKPGRYMRIFHNSDLRGAHGSVLVPTFGDEVFLVRIFRHPVRAWSLELPRGFNELGLSDSENASRETMEELGVAALETIPLGTVAPDTGMLATKVQVFHVPLQSRPLLQSNGAAQQQEAIEQIVPVPRTSILSGLRQDERLRGITCGLTLAAITHAVARGILT